jgi:hypothetical protein
LAVYPGDVTRTSVRKIRSGAVSESRIRRGQGVPVLTIESRENLRLVATETLDVGQSEVNAAELIRSRVLDVTRHLPLEKREDAVNAALLAFERGSFLLLVDGRRVTELEEHLRLGEEMHVRFWQLVPLVGG